MTIHTIDNSAQNYGCVVLWQYDRATRLLRLLNYFQMLYNASVSTFWTYWISGILNFDTCGTFGLNAWGQIIGVQRPKITVTESGVTSERYINDATYRKLLKAAFFILKSDASLPAIAKYTQTLFSVDNSYTAWTVTIPSSTTTTGWTGSVTSISVGSEWKWKLAVYNSSSQLMGYEMADVDATDMRLKVYGVAFGEIEVTAVRHHHCGVTITDGQNMDLTYGQHATYFQQMDADQQALYNQLSEEYLVYPLGVRYNHMYETEVFAFSGQQNTGIQFSSSYIYSKGDIVAKEVTDEYGNPERVFFECQANDVVGEWEDVSSNFTQTMADSDMPWAGSFNGDYPTDEFLSRTAYVVGQKVISPSGDPYCCITAITAAQNTGWAAASAYFASMTYAANTAYAVDTFIVGAEDGMVYCCTTALSAENNVNWTTAKPYFTLCWNDTVFRN